MKNRTKIGFFMRRPIHCLLLAIFLVLVLGTCYSSDLVFANVSENWSNSVVQKALLKGLHRCYSTGAVNYDAGKLSNFKNFNQLLIGGTASDYVALPSGLTNVNDNNIDCKSLFQGWSSFKGIFELAGKSEYKKDITNVDQKIAFLEGMGYSKVESEEKKCVVYFYTADYEGKSAREYTDQVCYTDSGGLSVEDGGEHIPYFETTDKYTLKVSATLEQSMPETVKYVSYAFSGENSGWSGFVSKLNKTMSTYFKMVSNDYLQFDNSGASENNYGDAVFKLKSSRSGGVADKAISFLSSYKKYDDLAFTDKEKLSYFVDTIKNWFYSGMSTSDYLKCDISDQSLYGSYLMINIDISTMKKSSTCGIDTSRISSERYAYGFVGNQFDASGDTKLYLADVVKEINSLVGKMSDEDLASIVSDSTSDDDTTVEQNCNNSSGSLGWILCPILEGLASAANTAWEDYIQPALQIDTVLLGNDDASSSGSSDAAEIAWEIFRNFANIIFTVFFLFVIFSQLTGVGIDNYGIKKILPKLIVVAILVNLSFLICQIAVDLSNILGGGLYDVMNDMGNDIALQSSMTINGSTLNLGSGFLTAIVVLMAVAFAVGAFWENGIAILIPLLVGALSVVISIAFLFILLSVRQAGVVVLVVVSPIAFICYLLPNAKERIFNKWLKALEGLLLLYPICGLLVGGGNFVSKLLLSTGAGNENIFLALTTMIAGIAPIFFIPTLLKGAFAAIGNIGNTISNLGNRVGKGVSSGVGNRLKNSETLRRADNALGRHSLSKRRRAKSVADTAALTRERAERDRLGDRKNIKTRLASITASEEAKATDEATAQRLSLMMSSGKQGGIVMEDGTRAAYTLDNAEKRVIELRDTAAKRSLSGEEKLELSALSRGMSNMAGGAGKLGKAIRGASVSDPATGQSKANSNFMSAMGEIYSRDSAVQNKLNEKDAGASAFTENFMPGGQGYNGDFAAYQGTSEYKDTMDKRIKSYSAGLNQGGAAVDDYINSLSNNDIQSIMDNKELHDSLDTDVRAKIDATASSRGISRKPHQVEIVGGAPVLGSTSNPGVARPGESFDVQRGTTVTDSGIILGGTDADIRRAADQNRRQGGGA